MYVHVHRIPLYIFSTSKVLTRVLYMYFLIPLVLFFPLIPFYSLHQFTNWIQFTWLYFFYYCSLSLFNSALALVQEIMQKYTNASCIGGTWLYFIQFMQNLTDTIRFPSFSFFHSSQSVLSFVHLLFRMCRILSLFLFNWFFSLSSADFYFVKDLWIVFFSIKC